MNRPALDRVAFFSGHTHLLDFVAGAARPGECLATMAEGQWDAGLAAMYDHGFTLLEVNDRECVVATYKKGS